MDLLQQIMFPVEQTRMYRPYFVITKNVKLTSVEQINFVEHYKCCFEITAFIAVVNAKKTEVGFLQLSKFVLTDLKKYGFNLLN